MSYCGTKGYNRSDTYTSSDSKNSKLKSIEEDPTNKFKISSLKWCTNGCKADKSTKAGVVGFRTLYSEPMRTYSTMCQTEIKCITPIDKQP